MKRSNPKYGYLPEQELRNVSEETGHSLVDIYGVATFYRAFSLKPRGKHLISVCLGTACHVRGGPAIAKEIEAQLGIKAGETSSDGEFTLETVNCLGRLCSWSRRCCRWALFFQMLKYLKLREFWNKAREGFDRIEIETDKRVFPLEVSCAQM